MNCINCGAELEPGALICPYCGTENEAVAKAQHENEIREIHEKIDQLDKTMQEDRVRKVNHSLSRLALIVGALVLLLIVGIFAVTRIQSGVALSRQQKNLEKLEGYYQDGDYDAVVKYMDKYKLKGNTFGKYQKTKDAMEWMDYGLSYVGDEENYFKYVMDYEKSRDGIAYSLEININSLCRSLYQLDQMGEKGYLYGEQAVVEYAKEQVMQAFETHFLVTEEEVEPWIALQGEEDVEGSWYKEQAQMVADRLWQSGRFQESE
ncbi:MAG: zinc ribbon domain-containing protein [Lachnospiraceae bacterium]|nr:zinc ribbon domain-containing protein [Lachnospiraceae bacterium]